MYKYNALTAFHSLIRQESIVDLDIFIEDFETYEEIPFVSRIHRLCRLREMFSNEEVQLFLVNCSIFILNNIAQHARKNLEASDSSSFFACLTFFEDEIEEDGYTIPNFLVTRKLRLFDFLRERPEISPENLPPLLGNAFLDIGAGKTFRFVKTITPDVSGDFSRIYAIPRAALDRIG
jgi:hypothetical protein